MSCVASDLHFLQCTVIEYSSPSIYSGSVLWHFIRYYKSACCASRNGSNATISISFLYYSNGDSKIKGKFGWLISLTVADNETDMQ